MKTYSLLCAAAFLAVILAGCAGVDARREQRWAAFDPLRPDPEFRLLPDRPLLKFSRSGNRSAAGERAEEAAPLVWKSAELDSRGLEGTASRFYREKFELYMIARTGFRGKLRARALNERREEVGRAVTTLERNPDEAGWVEFRFPERFALEEVKVIAVELAE